MATRIVVTRKFEVDSYQVTLTAGVKDDQPMVVLGFPSLGFQELQNITIEYPMKTEKAATAFVVKADEEVIRRGIAKYYTDVDDVAQRVNAALMQPYNPHSFTTRGQKQK